MFDGNMKPNLPPILFGTLPTHPMLQPRPNRVEPENAVAEQDQPLGRKLNTAKGKKFVLGRSVWTLADGEWHAAAAGLKPLCLLRAQSATVRDSFLGPKPE